MTKEELLKEVWNTCSFDEIIDAGIQYEKCAGEDIVNAASIYDTPDREYSEEEIESLVEHAELKDIIEQLDRKYQLEEIIDFYDYDDVCDAIDNYNLMSYLEGTWEMNKHDEEIRGEAYSDGYDDAINEYDESKEYIINDIVKTKDSLWSFLCDTFGITYYDKEGFEKNIKDLIDKH